MREILFRGFHPDENGKEKAFVNGEWINGFWVYGYYFEEIGSFIKERPGSVSTLTYLVLIHTVGQYTGLKDKNGKKIFEGDILRHSKNQKTMSVAWDGVESQFVWHKRKENNKHLFDSGSLFLTNRYFEIIGNIFENPELLEDQA